MLIKKKIQTYINFFRKIDVVEQKTTSIFQKNDIINFTKIKYILKFCVRILNIFIFIMIKNKIKIEKEGIKARKTK